VVKQRHAVGQAVVAEEPDRAEQRHAAAELERERAGAVHGGDHVGVVALGA
jgi:hypothetical protein